MEFSISKKNLLECLNHFQSVVEKRNTIPILSNIKLIVDETNGLEITATDLALEVSETLSANIIKSGGITIPSQLFYDIIRKAPDSSNIELRKDEKVDLVYVAFNESRFSIPTLPVDDFPVMDLNELDTQIELESISLKDLIDNCKFCMGLDESRQYLNGIYLHLSKNLISTVATDGHRLSKSSLTKDFSGDFDGIIIPKKTVLEISKILEEFEGKISLNFSKTRLKIHLGHIKIITKLINSSFPDYESVIPTANDQIMEVDCKSFSESIDRVSTISNEKFRTVKFDVSNNVCVVSSFGTEKSIGTENVKVGYSGPAFSINFNSRYVLDVLNIIKEGKVKFFFSKDTAPTILETPSIKNSLVLNNANESLKIFHGE